jgi:GDP-L-fucose synthase
MELNSKIYISGHTGLVGSKLLELLKDRGYTNLIFRTSKELDLREQKAVHEFFEKEKPEYVFLIAGKVGGIGANSTYPAEFIYDNLMIESNIIHASFKFNVKKLLFTGSSCIYPKLSEQPIKESSLLSGSLEPTNEPYAIAKIAGIKLCQAYRDQYGCDFISVMPTNLYGPNDNFDLENSHVIPALIGKFYEAKVQNKKEVVLWGTGTPQREFLYIKDLVDALVFLIHNYSEQHIINIGTGKDIAIKELAELIKKETGYGGNIIWDDTKPDGTPKKQLDVSKLNSLGWASSVGLEEGLKETIAWYNKENLK